MVIFFLINDFLGIISLFIRFIRFNCARGILFLYNSYYEKWFTLKFGTEGYVFDRDQRSSDQFGDFRWSLIGCREISISLAENANKILTIKITLFFQPRRFPYFLTHIFHIFESQRRYFENKTILK